MKPDPDFEAMAQQLRLAGYLVSPPGFATHADYRAHLRAQNVLGWLGDEALDARAWSALKACCAEMTVGQLADEALGGRLHDEGFMGEKTLLMVLDVLIRHGVITR